MHDAADLPLPAFGTGNSLWKSSGLLWQDIHCGIGVCRNPREVRASAFKWQTLEIAWQTTRRLRATRSGPSRID